MLSLPWLGSSSGTFWFNARVPAAIARRVGRRILTRSLRTKDPETARIRLHGLSMTVAAAYSQISRNLPDLSDGEICRILDEALVAGVKLFDRQIAMHDPNTGFDLAREIERQTARLAALREALRHNNLAPVDSSGSQLLADAGVEFDIASVDYRMFLRRRLAMEVRRAEIEGRRLEGDYSDALPVLSVGQAQSGPTESAPMATGPAQGREEGLLKAFENFKSENLRAKRRLKTMDQYMQSLMLFVELFGDLRCCDLTANHGVEFKEKLLQIPVDYRRNKKLKSLSIVDLVGRRLVEKGHQALALKTVNRHIGALCTFGKWLGKNRYLVPQGNPFGGLFLPTASDPREERQVHCREDLLKLFLSPVWTGCASRSRRALPGPYLFKDAKFFVPLLGLYNGLRLEEACQLMREDVRHEAGIWVIFVRPDRTDEKPAGSRLGKRVKTRSSARIVPLHPFLIEMGFVEFVRGGSSKALFEELSRDNKYGAASAGFTQWFGRFRRAVGCGERFKDFHSLRHNYIDCAINSGIDPSIVEELDGHRPAGQTRGRYHKGYKIEVLYQAVCKIRFGIEAELKAAVERLAD
jgi:integrase